MSTFQQFPVRSITEVKMICSNCLKTMRLLDCESGADGTPMCPDCDEPCVQVPDA